MRQLLRIRTHVSDAKIALELHKTDRVTQVSWRKQTTRTSVQWIKTREQEASALMQQYDKLRRDARNNIILSAQSIENGVLGSSDL